MRPPRSVGGCAERQARPRRRPHRRCCTRRHRRQAPPPHSRCSVEAAESLRAPRCRCRLSEAARPRRRRVVGGARATPHLESLRRRRSADGRALAEQPRCGGRRRTALTYKGGGVRMCGGWGAEDKSEGAGDRERASWLTTDRHQCLTHPLRTPWHAHTHHPSPSGPNPPHDSTPGLAVAPGGSGQGGQGGRHSHVDDE